MTKGAAKTTEGIPYTARWSSDMGNMKTRHVRRPEAISTFFSCSNIIDRHNHLRQAELAIEETWPEIQSASSISHHLRPDNMRVDQNEALATTTGRPNACGRKWC